MTVPNTLTNSILSFIFARTRDGIITNALLPTSAAPTYKQHLHNELQDILERALEHL